MRTRAPNRSGARPAASTPDHRAHRVADEHDVGQVELGTDLQDVVGVAAEGCVGEVVGGDVRVAGAHFDGPSARPTRGTMPTPAGGAALPAHRAARSSRAGPPGRSPFPTGHGSAVQSGESWRCHRTPTLPSTFT